MPRSAVLVAAAVGAVVVGIAAEAASFGTTELNQAGADLATGWTIAACGLVTAWRRPESRVGPLLTAAGLAWFIGNFSAVTWPLPASLAAHASLLYLGLLVHAIITAPGGRPRNDSERVAIAGGYLAALMPQVSLSGPGAVALAGLLLLAVFSLRRDAPPGYPLSRRLALAAAVLVAGALAATAILPRIIAGGGGLEVDFAFDFMIALAAALLAGGALGAFGLARVVADLVVEVGETRRGGLADALAEALGDPTLEVGYRREASDAFEDATGRPVRLPGANDPRVVTAVERNGLVVAILVHNAAVLQDPGVRQAVDHAAGLAAANAQLGTEVQGQLLELIASRGRLLRAEEDERRALELRLERSVGRSLDALELTLVPINAQASAFPTDVADTIETAVSNLAAARGEILELARGLRPHVLLEGDLRGALGVLVAQCAVPVTLEVDDGECDPETGAAIYFVCGEALANIAKHAGASAASIAVQRSRELVSVIVSDDGAGGAVTGGGTGLVGLRERVTRLGGSLEIDSPVGRGTRLTARLPVTQG